jgi:hypothetical protein
VETPSISTKKGHLTVSQKVGVRMLGDPSTLPFSLGLTITHIFEGKGLKEFPSVYDVLKTG